MPGERLKLHLWAVVSYLSADVLLSGQRGQRLPRRPRRPVACVWSITAHRLQKRVYSCSNVPPCSGNYGLCWQRRFFPDSLSTCSIAAASQRPGPDGCGQPDSGSGGFIRHGTRLLPSCACPPRCFRSLATDGTSAGGRISVKAPRCHQRSTNRSILWLSLSLKLMSGISSMNR